MTVQHKQELEAEIASLLAHGMKRVSVDEFECRYREAGFRFDKSCTIRQFSSYISGPRAGERSPSQTMYPVHIDTGMSAFHNELPRTEYEKVKALRNSIFAVSRSGYILEV